MEINKKEICGHGIKFYYGNEGEEFARAYLYVLQNDLHDDPFGLMEDVFVEESCRGKGYGKEIVNAVINEAREIGCYKLICTSRHEKPKVHDLYEKLGFENHGIEFRINFND